MSSKAKTCGFGLLEVLISILIIGVSAAGVSQFIVAARRAEYDAQLRKTAMMLLQDLANRIRANYINGQMGATSTYISTVTPPTNMPATTCIGVGNLSCTNSQLATYDLWDWGQYINSTMPLNSVGQITLSQAGTGTSAPIFTITLSWTGSQQTAQQATLQVSPLL